MADLYEIAKFIFLSGASGVIGNLSSKGLEKVSSFSLRKITAFFEKKKQGNLTNLLEEVLKTGDKGKFEEFLNSLDDDLRKGLIEVLREIEQKAKELNINIGKINIKNENVGGDKRKINNYGRYAEGDYFEKVEGDIVKGDKNIYINQENLKKN